MNNASHTIDTGRNTPNRHSTSLVGIPIAKTVRLPLGLSALHRGGDTAGEITQIEKAEGDAGVSREDAGWRY